MTEKLTFTQWLEKKHYSKSSISTRMRFWNAFRDAGLTKEQIRETDREQLLLLVTKGHYYTSNYLSGLRSAINSVREYLDYIDNVV